ncbi:pyrroloquinoline quinone biosynthesis peptide chaperone PqqD [Azospirillum sp. A1-3]|jgi:pyrroloquinoline quinone biosynthesis protein D|uniref:pyrroloquinoline quinone biosynthesis peptide chaperone PqqD n=1 Tax=Azospirillum sp. A1-3 TaxID=185874 RepID=UPI0020774D91|nr:pyrroloquinoline quinone biosynthesis peptide chaperone PqqD [Azospirillum sp. A1-3]MCM8735757.1 pyrroloquinoline quinone biosynthesis peptide chaperone PqqD [Azospirillum sp. A1-3]
MEAVERLGPRAIVEINPVYLFRWEESQNAHILLYPEGVVKLNDTAAEILKTCTGELPVAAAIADLSARFNGADVVSDVMEFLEMAHAKGWIRIKS